MMRTFGKEKGEWRWVGSKGTCLTGAAACTGVDGFIPLVGAGHGEGALVHAVFAAAKRQPARLQG